jgi:hypothetical protein
MIRIGLQDNQSVPGSNKNNEEIGEKRKWKRYTNDLSGEWAKVFTLGEFECKVILIFLSPKFLTH